MPCLRPELLPQIVLVDGMGANTCAMLVSLGNDVRRFERHFSQSTQPNDRTAHKYIFILMKTNTTFQSVWYK